MPARPSSASLTSVSPSFCSSPFHCRWAKKVAAVGTLTASAWPPDTTSSCPASPPLASAPSRRALEFGLRTTRTTRTTPHDVPGRTLDLSLPSMSDRRGSSSSSPGSSFLCGASAPSSAELGASEGRISLKSVMYSPVHSLPLRACAVGRVRSCRVVSCRVRVRVCGGACRAG